MYNRYISNKIGINDKYQRKGKKKPNDEFDQKLRLPFLLVFLFFFSNSNV